MWTLKKKIFYASYLCFGSWLPESRRFICAKAIRIFFATKVISKYGIDINIEKGAKFTPEVTIGNHSGIGINCELIGPVCIGDYVMMGPEVVIYTQNHEFRDLSVPMQKQGYQKIKPVLIGNDVWIGRRVIILPGVTIGDGCIIGAGSIVTKNVEPYSISVGIPAKIISKRL